MTTERPRQLGTAICDHDNCTEHANTQRPNSHGAVRFYCQAHDPGPDFSIPESRLTYSDGVSTRPLEESPKTIHQIKLITLSQGGARGREIMEETVNNFLQELQTRDDYHDHHFKWLEGSETLCIEYWICDRPSEPDKNATIPRPRRSIDI
jgi:hypothetical protein